MTKILAVDLCGDVFIEVKGLVFPESLILVVAMPKIKVVAMPKIKVEFVVLDLSIAFAWGVIMAFMLILFLLMAKFQVLSEV